MNYRRQYHCLLCSSLYIGDDLPHEYSSDEDAALMNINNERDYSRFYTHYCEDGGIGVALFAGYRRITEYDIS